MKEIMTSGNARKKKFIEFYMTRSSQSNMAGSSDGAATQTGAIIEVNVKLKRNVGLLNLCDCFLLVVSINLSLYQLTDEERAVLKECSRNSILFRGNSLIELTLRECKNLINLNLWS